MSVNRPGFGRIQARLLKPKAPRHTFEGMFFCMAGLGLSARGSGQSLDDFTQVDFEPLCLIQTDLLGSFSLLLMTISSFANCPEVATVVIEVPSVSISRLADFPGSSAATLPTPPASCLLNDQ